MNAVPTPPKSKLLTIDAAAYVAKENKQTGKAKPKTRFVPKPHLTTRVQDTLPVDVVTQLLTFGI